MRCVSSTDPIDPMDSLAGLAWHGHSRARTASCASMLGCAAGCRQGCCAFHLQEQCCIFLGTHPVS